MNKALQTQRTTLILLIILVVALLVGGISLFRLMQVRMDKVVQIKERIASYQKNKKAYAAEADRIHALENRTAVLEASVVRAETVPTLLSELEQLATASGVGFQITSVQNPVENEVPKLLVQSTIKGSRAQVLSFLEQVQHQTFAVRFAELFVFSEEGEKQPVATAGVLAVGTSKPSVAVESKWQAAATIEILSF